MSSACAACLYWILMFASRDDLEHAVAVLPQDRAELIGIRVVGHDAQARELCPALPSIAAPA
jgi:hypothetical protein